MHSDHQSYPLVSCFVCFLLPVPLLNFDLKINFSFQLIFSMQQGKMFFFMGTIMALVQGECKVKYIFLVAHLIYKAQVVFFIIIICRISSLLLLSSDLARFDQTWHKQCLGEM